MKSSKKLMIVLLALAIVTALSAGTLAIYTTQIDDAASTTVTAKVINLAPGDGFPYTESFELAPGQSDYTALYKLFNSKDGNVSEVDMSLRITPSFGDLFTNYPYMSVELHKGKRDESVVVATWDKDNDAAYEADGLWAANVEVEQDYFLKGNWEGSSTDDADKNAQDNLSLSDGGKQTISLKFTASQYIGSTASNNE